MLFRIDKEHLLTHMIDHFTRDELAEFQYAIISAGIKTGGRVRNMAKINGLYPSPDIQELWRESKDKKLLKKAYFDMCKEDDMSPLIYETFINPILKHVNIVIVCMEIENPYIDVLVDYLKINFDIDCIDLNELFIKGRVGSIYMDWGEIHNKAVDIRREAGKRFIKEKSMTSDGRAKLLTMMTKKQKIEKLEEEGIKVTKADRKDLDKLLTEEWVED